MLDTDEEDDEVFLLRSTTLEFWSDGALSPDGARSSVWMIKCVMSYKSQFVELEYREK